MKEHSKVKIFIKISCLILILCFLPISCVLGNNPIVNVQAASDMKISKTKATLIKGKTIQLKITGTDEKVTWESSNTKIATVSTSGKVSAKAKGTATITATIGKQTFSCKITVENPSISNASAILIKGQTLQLSMKGTNQKVTWKSSKESVATVTSDGIVAAKKKGNATITATLGKTSYTCDITVETPKINVSSMELTVNDTYQLNVSGTSQDIAWNSSNKKIVTVTSKGKIKAKKLGTATITAQIGEKKLTCIVTVEPVLSTDKTSIKIESGKSAEVKITMRKNETIRYEIDNTDIVSCSWGEWSGDTVPLTIKAKTNGSTTITITNKYNDEAVEIKVTVPYPWDDVEVVIPETIGEQDAPANRMKITNYSFYSPRSSYYYMDYQYKLVQYGNKSESSWAEYFYCYDKDGNILKKCYMYTSSLSLNRTYSDDAMIPINTAKIIFMEYPDDTADSIPWENVEVVIPETIGEQGCTTNRMKITNYSFYSAPYRNTSYYYMNYQYKLVQYGKTGRSNWGEYFYCYDSDGNILDKCHMYASLLSLNNTYSDDARIPLGTTKIVFMEYPDNEIPLPDDSSKEPNTEISKEEKENPASIADNINRLVNYIVSNGRTTTNSSDRTIQNVGDGITSSITYGNYGGNYQLLFHSLYEDDTYQVVINFYYDIPSLTIDRLTIYYLSKTTSVGTFTATAPFDISTYDATTNLNFTLNSSMWTTITDEELQEFCNVHTKLAVLKWGILLMEQLKMRPSDIGFLAFENSL